MPNIIVKRSDNSLVSVKQKLFAFESESFGVFEVFDQYSVKVFLVAASTVAGLSLSLRAVLVGCRCVICCEELHDAEQDFRIGEVSD